MKAILTALALTAMPIAAQAATYVTIPDQSIEGEYYGEYITLAAGSTQELIIDVFGTATLEFAFSTSGNFSGLSGVSWELVGFSEYYSFDSVVKRGSTVGNATGGLESFSTGAGRYVIAFYGDDVYSYTIDAAIFAYNPPLPEVRVLEPYVEPTPISIPAPVPVPAAGLMALGGIAALGALRVRRKKA